MLYKFLLLAAIILLTLCGVFITYVIVVVLTSKEPVEFDNGKPKII